MEPGERLESQEKIVFIEVTLQYVFIPRIITMNEVFLIFMITLLRLLLQPPLYLQVWISPGDKQQRSVDLFQILLISPGHANNLSRKIHPQHKCRLQSFSYFVFYFYYNLCINHLYLKLLIVV